MAEIIYFLTFLLIEGSTKLQMHESEYSAAIVYVFCGQIFWNRKMDQCVDISC